MDLHLLKEDDNSYEIGHPKSGKKMSIPKKGLSPKAHDMIKSMKVQHFWGGGESEQANLEASSSDAQLPQHEYVAPAPQVDPYAAEAAQIQATGQIPGITDAPVDQSAQPPTQDVAAQAPAAQTSSDPLVQNKLDQEGLLNKQEQDIGDYEKAAVGSGNAEAKAYGDFANQLGAMQTPQQIVDSYKGKDDALMTAYMNNKLDPDRYVHNMSTGSKIAAGVGLMLSGLGAASAGQSNYALDHLNKSIDNDIASQKNSQDKQLNLYHMNQQALGNDQAALLATKNQMWTGVQAKIMQAQASLASPTAKLRAQQQIAQIEQQKIQNRMMLGLLNQGNQGGISKADPVSLVPSLVPAEHQKQALTEIGQAQAASSNQDKILAAFEDANKQNTLVGRTMRAGMAPPSIKVLNALADPLIHDNEGRINELEQQHVQALWPSPGDVQSTVDQKRRALTDFIQHKKAAPTAKAFGINVDNFASTSNSPAAHFTPQQSQFYNWAKANPNDPKAQLVLKKLGVQ